MNTHVLKTKGVLFILVSIFMMIVLLCSVQTASYAGIDSVTVKPGDDDTSLIVTLDYSYHRNPSGNSSRTFLFEWRQKTPPGEWKSGKKGFSDTYWFYVDREYYKTISYTIKGLIPDTTYEVRVDAGDIHEGTTNFIPLSISAASRLTEANLDKSVVTLTLSYDDIYEADVATLINAVSVTGIDGVTIDTATVKRLSDRKIQFELDYDGTDFIRDTALTFTLTSKAIANHNGELTTEIPVTANRNDDVLTIFWTDYGTDKIQRANLDMANLEVSNVEDLVTGLDRPLGIALDVAGGKMYWTDWSTDKIKRANLDGSNVEDLVTQGLDGPWGIALDIAGGKMYWTDSDTEKIQRANLDGSNIEDLVTGLSGPEGIALDVLGGKMYWTDFGPSKIQRANLDGSNVEDLVTQGLETPSGIALDVAGGKMYWIDWDTEKIQRANLDGSNIEDLVTQGLGSLWGGPSGIALDIAGGKMYWTDNGTDKIKRANLDGSNVEDLVTQGLDGPSGIAIAMSSLVNPTTEPTIVKEDVNGDGIVDGKDIDALITAIVDGITDAKYDVNGDGTVDVNDVVAVNANRDDAAGAPARLGNLKLSAVAVNRLQEQIDLLIATDDRSPAAIKTLIYLQQLIALARPEKTQLLANFPNPFNPETWIPYQLAQPADVTLTIYDVRGRVVRAVDLGHQAAGVYQSRSRAAYWDGRNAFGEPVASGLYFYTLTAGDFSATRKMLIRK